MPVVRREKDLFLRWELTDPATQSKVFSLGVRHLLWVLSALAEPGSRRSRLSLMDGSLMDTGTA